MTSIYATTPAHMVHFHGYDRDHAARQAGPNLTVEHQRLHEDETAVHLDHTHESVLVATKS